MKKKKIKYTAKTTAEIIKTLIAFIVITIMSGENETGTYTSNTGSIASLVWRQS